MYKIWRRDARWVPNMHTSCLLYLLYGVNGVWADSSRHQNCYRGCCCWLLLTAVPHSRSTLLHISLKMTHPKTILFGKMFICCQISRKLNSLLYTLITSIGTIWQAISQKKQNWNWFLLIPQVLQYKASSTLSVRQSEIYPAWHCRLDRFYYVASYPGCSCTLCTS